MKEPKKKSAPAAERKLSQSEYLVVVTEAYAKIVEWLYVNDGAFPTKNQWRDRLLLVIKEQLGLIPERES